MASDPLFLPVGHTDEASASGGGSSELYSPFNGLFNPKTAAMMTAREAGWGKVGTTRTNPPEISVSKLTKAQFKDLSELEGSVTSIPLYLGLGGYIVKKDWDSALSLCAAIKNYIKQASKVISPKTGKPLIKTGRGTYYAVVNAIEGYIKQIKAGVEPFRNVTVRGQRVRKTLWESIWDSCLAVSGNVKLPFAAYSEMPVVTCPGAGSVSGKYGVLTGNALGAATPNNTENGCANWCYSIKAIAKPSFVARMLITTLGMSLDPEKHVAAVTQKMIHESQRAKKPNILRLFVDGDFRDVNSIRLWMNACKELHKHGIKVYGYSKSWENLVKADKRFGRSVWAPNYVLNLSSGSRFGEAKKKEVAALPISRSEFVAVNPFLKLVEKAYQIDAIKKHGRAKGKAIGRVMANRVFSVYNKALDRDEEALRKAKSSRNRAAVAEAKRKVATLEQSMRDRLARMAPDLFNAWLDYEVQLQKIKSRASSYNTSVAKAKREAGTRAEKIITGKTTLFPGQVLQATTWKFLQLVKQSDEFACPIDCGKCPRSAIADHDKSVNRLMKGEFNELREEMKAVIEKKITLPAGTVHACGNARIKQKIIIGVH
ncbi:MAG: hypothetical protein F6K48_03145 [Okeania sp. SIO3H1]|nr:hypothetical protein [Okeania sp. SIO3H1]